jgi:hypothetical protein
VILRRGQGSIYTPLSMPLENPGSSADPKQRCFKGASNALVADERTVDSPEALTAETTTQIGLYTHRCQADWTSRRGPGVETPDYPAPRIGVGVLRECHASTGAYLYVQVQHIVVDLEEPRSLRPTVTWPASGAMRHPACKVCRFSLPRTRVNKGRLP